MANIIVKKALAKQNVPVVEVNLESCIEDGYGIIVEEKSEVALPILFEEIMKQQRKR